MGCTVGLCHVYTAFLNTYTRYRLVECYLRPFQPRRRQCPANRQAELSALLEITAVRPLQHCEVLEFSESSPDERPQLRNMRDVSLEACSALVMLCLQRTDNALHLCSTQRREAASLSF